MKIFVIETWRSIVGFEGLYEVSDHGRARSVDCWRPHTSKSGTLHKRFRKGKMISLCPHTSGYLMLHLYREGERTPVTLHRAVMEAFVGPRPEGLDIMHADDERTHCRLSNLSYGTKAQNEADKVARGRSLKGERQPISKLTTKDVVEIRRRRGEDQYDLADEFDCTHSNISAIQLRKSWRHI